MPIELWRIERKKFMFIECNLDKSNKNYVQTDINVITVQAYINSQLTPTSWSLLK